MMCAGSKINNVLMGIAAALCLFPNALIPNDTILTMSLSQIPLSRLSRLQRSQVQPLPKGVSRGPDQGDSVGVVTFGKKTYRDRCGLGLLHSGKRRSVIAALHATLLKLPVWNFLYLKLRQATPFGGGGIMSPKNNSVLSWLSPFSVTS